MSDGARVVAGMLCLLVLVSIAVPAGGQATPQTGIGEVSVSGGGVIDTAGTDNDSTYLWEDESVNASVTFADYPDAQNYRVCLGYERANAPAEEVDCGLQALPNGTNGTVEFTNVTWPANATGEQGLTVELHGLSNESNATVLDRKTVPVTVLMKQGDFDGDGLTNAREVEEGYNVSNPDMDSDGLSDGAEVNQYGSDSQNPDSDGDGIRDGVEVQQGTDPTDRDTDGDGFSDSTELALGTDPADPWTPVWLAATVLVVVGALVAVFMFARRRWRERFGGAVTANGDEETGVATADHGDEAPESSAESSPESAPEPTPEPLTDEDRVLALLRNHGGRMKQSRIVEETEWSKAKVSRLLSAMNDEGTIEKLSIGRENIISLDGYGPEAAQSPYEERSDASS